MVYFVISNLFFLFCLFSIGSITFAGENISVQQDIIQIIEEIDREADLYLQNTSVENKHTSINTNTYKEKYKPTIPATNLKSKLREKKASNPSAEKFFKLSHIDQPEKTSGEFDEIKGLFNNWIEVWSKGDFDAYINFYTKDFSTTNKTREQWIANRKQRIKPEKKVSLQVTDIEFKVIRENKIIQLQYMQKYSSIHYTDLSKKQLLWKKINGDWLISSERTIQQ